MFSRLNFKKTDKGKLSNKLTMILFVEALLIIGILFGVMYTQSYNMVVDYLGDKAIGIAEVSAKKVDISEFKNLNNIEDQNKASYKKMREELINIREISGSRYIYAIKLNENGEYVYVVDGSDYDDESAADIGEVEQEYPGFKEALNGETYVGKEMEVDQYGVFVSSYYPIKDEKDVVIGFMGVDYDVEQMYMKFKKFRNIAFVLSVVLGIASIIIGIIISRKLTKPIENMAEVSDKVANFDLNVEKISVKSKDEIGVLARSINIMIDNLRSIMSDVKETSEYIEANSVQLREQSNQTGKASEEIAIATTEIANGTAIQTEHIERIVTDIGEHLKEVNEGAIKSGESFKTAKLSTEIAFNGKKSIDKSIENLDYVSRNIEFATNSIQNLGKRSSEISNIVTVIADVAAQTNLLALNASIEAARAGEHGRGFAVVADEIRKLADQSEQSTRGITELINDIISETSVAVRTMESNLESINSQVHMIKDGGDALQEIVNKVEENEKNSKDINDAFDKIKEISNHVAESITEISTIVQEASATTEQVAASAEEQSAITDEMALKASELSNIIKNLNDKVDKFTLK